MMSANNRLQFPAPHRRDMVVLLMRAALVVALTLVPFGVSAQKPPGEQFSKNMKLISHLPLAGPLEVLDIEVEQELSRPYAYVSRASLNREKRSPAGFQIIDMRKLDDPKVLMTWSIDPPGQELHVGSGMAGKYFKHKG